MNKEKIVFNDRVKIIYPKKSKSELNLNNEKSLIDYKNIIQSDNFSFLKEKEKTTTSETMFYSDNYKLCDVNNLKNIKKLNKVVEEKLSAEDNYVKNKSNNYEILFPSDNFDCKVGENIYFECCLITENELEVEDFEDLIWVSNLDGLIGVKNKFNAILSFGYHIINLILIKNENRIIKDTVKINVSLNELKSPEINKL